MADVDSYNKPQRRVSEIGSPIQPNQANPRKFCSHFLYKAVVVAFFLVILPLFPSRAPEFIDQTILIRNWELLHLLFVGIAVSYGIFSRRNFETDKENLSKIDSAQNYVSRILQFSSVFDDEIETPSGSDENKIQALNSRYFRGEPVVVVTQESSVLDEQSNDSNSIGNKPLHLPVRSLRSRVSGPNALESIKEPGEFSGSSLSRSGSSLKGSSSSEKTRNGEIGDLDSLNLEEKVKENVVLPSPIPWRSRSGRMEMKEELGVVTPPLYSPPPSDSQSFQTPVSWPSRPSSSSSSPKNVSPSPSLSPELLAKNAQDLGRKKAFYKSSSTTAPAPPSSSSSPKNLSPSSSLSPELLAKNVQDLGRKKAFYKSSSPPSPAPPPINRKSPLVTPDGSPISKGFSENDTKRSFKDELKDLSSSGSVDPPTRGDSEPDSLKWEVKRKTHIRASSMGKSVRTIRASEPGREVKKSREIGGDQTDDITGKKSKGAEAVLMEKTERKTGEFDELSVKTEKQILEIPRPTPKPKFSKYQKQEMKQFIEKVIIESAEDSDGETDDIQGILDNEKAASGILTDAEVDKKADVFIAKFREQIRLQRIESIKRSSWQHSSRSSLR